MDNKVVPLHSLFIGLLQYAMLFNRFKDEEYIIMPVMREAMPSHYCVGYGCDCMFGDVEAVKKFRMSRPAWVDREYPKIPTHNCSGYFCNTCMDASAGVFGGDGRKISGH